MIHEIEQRRSELEAPCHRFGEHRPDVFGSAVSGAFRADASDLDFLVEFDVAFGAGYADRYFGLLESRQQLFERAVDLVVESAVKNSFFRESIERTKALLYAA